MGKVAKRATTPGGRPRLASVSRIAPAPSAITALGLLRELSEVAGRYVNKAPKQQRLAADRQALLDVLTRVQLYLSVEKATDKG